MKIGELATRSGVSVRALRYYEQQGLLGSERSSGGTRHYPESAVDQVWLIQQFYASGLASKSILTLLPHIESGTVAPEMLALLTTERDRINQHLADMTAVRDRLEAGIASVTSAMEKGLSCRPANSAWSEV
ncbi:MerR family transcriptional regulator [Catenuloplanes japonicus]|uniref:MerR family transcriptional regulator n=1 Tax=Catenuloplanes japonicus TaxID=33876 RepID=UPI00052595A7|nr:MerR family transcriptional regulator [Catenuloplanes japonicus]